MAGVAEEGPLIEFVDCQMAKACDANDDDCVAGAGTTDAEREAFTARCVAALSMSPPTRSAPSGGPSQSCAADHRLSDLSARSTCAPSMPA